MGDGEQRLAGDNPKCYLCHRSKVLPISPIVHNEGDLRCPIGQSEEIFQGLKMLGKEVEFIRYPGGSHVSRPPSQRVDRTRRIIEWFAGHAPSKRGD